jgi:predicted acyl esterase
VFPAGYILPTCPRGIPETYFWPYIGHRWGCGTGLVEDLEAETAEHPLLDGFWASKAADLSRVTSPAFVVASWSDQGLHTRGAFEGFKKISSPARPVDSHLLIPPRARVRRWVHDLNLAHVYATGPEGRRDHRLAGEATSGSGGTCRASRRARRRKTGAARQSARAPGGLPCWGGEGPDPRQRRWLAPGPRTRTGSRRRRRT